MFAYIWNWMEMLIDLLSSQTKEKLANTSFAELHSSSGL